MGHLGGNYEDHEGRALMSEIDALLKERSLAPFTMWGYSKNMAIYVLESGFSPVSKSASTLILDSLILHF